MNNKFGFVILHYLSDEDTQECVESIRQKIVDSSTASVEIVIVDNFSDNGSVERLETLYGGNSCIHFIKNKKNLGFARANNIGYKYCRNALKCDYIIVLNNDTIIDSNNFISQSIHDYETLNAGVIGPDIQSTKDDGHQNPVPHVIRSREDVNRERRFLRLNLQLCRWGLYDFVRVVKYKVLRRPKPIDNPLSSTWAEPRMHTQLHGACYIFTPLFLREFSLAFDDRTFMYLEEEILYDRCEEAGIKMIYDPAIKIYHKEESSTDLLNKSTKAKRIFRLTNLLDSLNVVETYMDEK